MSGVGTRKVYEDDHLTVWHLELAPGEHGAKHTHKLDYLFKVISGSTLEVYGAQDELLDTVELEPGGAHSFRIVGDEIHGDTPGYPVVPTTHSAKNVGTKTFREVLVEFKTQ